MFALVKINAWHWSGFVVCVVVFLLLDLRLVHHQARVIKLREALLWTAIWFSLAMLFALLLRPMRGDKEALQFVTGYLIELSLSMDNVFVIALLFAYFKIPSEHQHRVLFWGILGALIMRGLMILAGVSLIERFEWLLYLFGAFLIYTSLKMMFAEEEGVHPEKNPVIRLARNVYPVVNTFAGQKFIAHVDGRRALTPLAIVLLMVETTDVIFAVDSIPAIFGLTTDPFIVFTSNVFPLP